MSEAIVTIFGMGEPRITTVDSLMTSDYGHVVRFGSPHDAGSARRPIEAVLVRVREVDALTEPRTIRRFMLQLNFGEDAVRLLGRNPGVVEHGAFLERWPIEVLTRPGEVSVGKPVSSSLETRLDPASLEALAALARVK